MQHHVIGIEFQVSFGYGVTEVIDIVCEEPGT